MSYAHPVYTPEAVAAQRHLARWRRARPSSPGRTTAGASMRTAADPASRRRRTSGCTGERPGTRRVALEPARATAVAPPAVPSIVRGTVRHVRRHPMHRAFSYRVYQWLVDLDDLPRLRGAWSALASFRSADHLGDPRRSIRENLTAFAATQGVDLDGLPDPHAGERAVVRLRVRPADRVLVHPSRRRSSPASSPRSATRTASGTATSCTPTRPGWPGSRRRSTSRRSSPSRAATTCASSLDGPDVGVSIVLRQRGEVLFVATFRGRAAPAGRRSLAGCGAAVSTDAPAGSCTHPLARHPPLAPPPAGRPATATPPPGGGPMTLTESSRVHTSVIPPAPRASVRATVAAGIRAARAAQRPGPLQTAGGNVMGTRDRSHRRCRSSGRTRSSSRLGADVKIGFGEAYMAGDWRAAPGTDLADLLTPFAERIRSIVPRPVQWLRHYVEPRTPALRPEHRNRVRAGTSSGTTTCRTRCSRRSSTRP